MSEETLFGDIFEPAEQKQPSQAPATDNGPKAVNVESLMGALRKNGQAKLSDHVVNEDDNTKQTTKAKTEEKPAPAAAEPKKRKAKASSEEKLAAAKKAEDDKIAAEGFGAWLKAYLDAKAAENEEFAKVYAKPGKSLKECILYITGEAFKKALSGMAVIQNDVIEGLALHYYQEDDIEVNTKDNISFAVASQVFPLSDSDIEKVKTQANESMCNERLELEKKRIKDEILSGKKKVQLTEQEQKEIDAAARDALIEQSKNRQSKNSRRTSAPTGDKKKNEPANESLTLF